MEQKVITIRTPDAVKLPSAFFRAADAFDKACGMFGTYSSDVRENLALTSFGAYADAIKHFTGVQYHFSRTDEYYGICDDNDNFVYKVERQIKEKRSPNGQVEKRF